VSPADPVRELLARRGCPPHVVEGGLEGLLAHWESVVDEVDAVYALGLDDYLDDMDARQLLAEALAVAPPAARQAIAPRLREADERMQRLVVLAGRCLWGDEQARENGWTPDENWWYFTRPASPGPELQKDLGLPQSRD
jgi:hypothetical protein